MRILHWAILVATATVLSGCNPAPPKTKTTPASEFLELEAADVAWAIGMNIWKVECPSTDINGMELLVLDGDGKVVAGGGFTLAVHHRDGKKAILRVALKVEGESLGGRYSARDSSIGGFEYPNAFAGTRGVVTHHEPAFEGNQFVLMTQYAGDLSGGPVARQVVLRLRTDLPTAP